MAQEEQAPTEAHIKTVVVKRESSVPENVEAKTPAGNSNVLLVAMAPLKVVLIRAARTYLMSLTGILSSGGVGLDKGLLPNDFGSLLLAAAQISLAPAVMSLLLNSGELLAKLDQSHPQLRG